MKNRYYFGGVSYNQGQWIYKYNEKYIGIDEDGIIELDKTLGLNDIKIVLQNMLILIINKIELII